MRKSLLLNLFLDIKQIIIWTFSVHNTVIDGPFFHEQKKKGVRIIIYTLHNCYKHLSAYFTSEIQWKTKTYYVPGSYFLLMLSGSVNLCPEKRTDKENPSVNIETRSQFKVISNRTIITGVSNLCRVNSKLRAVSDIWKLDHIGQLP